VAAPGTKKNEGIKEYKLVDADSPQVKRFYVGVNN
jgi:hypothetical protein